MKLFTSILLASAWTVCAQPAVAPPRVGFIIDGTRALRPLLGFTGNLIVGDPTSPDVQAAAFSGRRGLAITSSAVIAFDANGQVLGTLDATPGSGPDDTLFAFLPGGQPGFVLQKSSLQLFAWSDSGFETISLDPALLGGQPVAMAAPDASRLRFVVSRPDGLWMLDLSAPYSSISGQTLLAGLCPPLLLKADGTILYTDANFLVLRRDDGSERRVDAKVPLGELRELGDGWVQAKDIDSGRQLAIRISQEQSEVSVIPEAPCCAR